MFLHSVRSAIDSGIHIKLIRRGKSKRDPDYITPLVKSLLRKRSKLRKLGRIIYWGGQCFSWIKTIALSVLTVVTEWPNERKPAQRSYGQRPGMAVMDLDLMLVSDSCQTLIWLTSSSQQSPPLVPTMMLQFGLCVLSLNSLLLIWISLARWWEKFKWETRLMLMVMK